VTPAALEFAHASAIVERSAMLGAEVNRLKLWPQTYRLAARSSTPCVKVLLSAATRTAASSGKSA